MKVADVLWYFLYSIQSVIGCIDVTLFNFNDCDIMKTFNGGSFRVVKLNCLFVSYDSLGVFIFVEEYKPFEVYSLAVVTVYVQDFIDVFLCKVVLLKLYVAYGSFKAYNFKN